MVTEMPAALEMAAIIAKTEGSPWNTGGRIDMSSVLRFRPGRRDIICKAAATSALY